MENRSNEFNRNKRSIKTLLLNPSSSFWQLELNSNYTYVRTFFDFSLLGSWGGFEVGTGLHFGWWNRICESSASSRTRGNTARIKKLLPSYIFYVCPHLLYFLYPFLLVTFFLSTSPLLLYLPSFLIFPLSSLYIWLDIFLFPHISVLSFFLAFLLFILIMILPIFSSIFLSILCPITDLSYWPGLCTNPNRSIKSPHVFLFSSQLGWISIWR